MMKCKVALPILAIAVAGAMLAQGAAATHVRPDSATPLYVPLVVAYKQCVAGASLHGSPLAFPSCVPPRQDSNFLTVGTPDANGASANSAGFVKLVVKATSPEDVLMTSSATDIRCTPATSASVCNGVNTGTAGADYSGQLQGTFLIRITDHWNGSPTFTSAGTMQDVGFPFNADCVNTASTGVGGTCSANTTLNAIVPGAFQDGKRSNVEVQTVQVNDGGSSGVAGAPDSTRFETEGVFTP
jgi:hypothetical protein